MVLVYEEAVGHRTDMYFLKTSYIFLLIFIYLFFASYVNLMISGYKYKLTLYKVYGI